MNQITMQNCDLTDNKTHHRPTCNRTSQDTEYKPNNYIQTNTKYTSWNTVYVYSLELYE